VIPATQEAEIGGSEFKVSKMLSQKQKELEV
jgi:hypothetical protein